MNQNDAKLINLPEGWKWVKLGEICEVVRGSSPRPMGDPKFFTGKIPFLKIADITKIQGKFVYDSHTKVNELGAEKSRLLKKGSLVLTNSASVCIPKFLGVDACIHDGFVTFQNFKIETKLDFLYHYFDYSRPYVIQNNKQGVTQVNLNIEIVNSFDIPLPPLSIQAQIVEKLETLLSELDKGKAQLLTAQAQLKTYRQAVLKYAFEGKLTGDTEGWEWVKMGEVIEKPQYGTSKKCDYDIKNKAVLRIPNIGNGFVDASDLKYADFDENEITSYQLKEGDLLTIRSNGSVDLVGKCALISKKDEKYLYAGYLIKLRPLIAKINSKYLLNVLSSVDLRSQIEFKAKSTSGVNNINSEELRSLEIPLPPSVRNKK